MDVKRIAQIPSHLLMLDKDHSMEIFKSPFFFFLFFLYRFNMSIEKG